MGLPAVISPIGLRFLDRNMSDIRMRVSGPRQADGTHLYHPHAEPRKNISCCHVRRARGSPPRDGEAKPFRYRRATLPACVQRRKWTDKTISTPNPNNPNSSGSGTGKGTGAATIQPLPLPDPSPCTCATENRSVPRPASKGNVIRALVNVRSYTALSSAPNGSKRSQPKPRLKRPPTGPVSKPLASKPLLLFPQVPERQEIPASGWSR